MAQYKISILGLYNYNNTLFDTLVFPIFHIPSPAPANPFLPDRDTLISLILEKSADFNALYPDWDFMHFMIGVWSKNCAYMMQKLFESQNYSYNPIHNYDRNSKISRIANSSSGGTLTDSQTAFNTDTFKDTGKRTSSETASGGETVTEETSGNIGVTSTQQMLEQERQVALFKWYDIVSDDFINKFCVQIY